MALDLFVFRRDALRNSQSPGRRRVRYKTMKAQDKKLETVYKNCGVLYISADIIDGVRLIICHTGAVGHIDDSAVGNEYDERIC